MPPPPHRIASPIGLRCRRPLASHRLRRPLTMLDDARLISRGQAGWGIGWGVASFSAAPCSLCAFLPGLGLANSIPPRLASTHLHPSPPGPHAEENPLAPTLCSLPSLSVSSCPHPPRNLCQRQLLVQTATTANSIVALCLPSAISFDDDDDALLSCILVSFGLLASPGLPRRTAFAPPRLGPLGKGRITPARLQTRTASPSSLPASRPREPTPESLTPATSPQYPQTLGPVQSFVSRRYR